MRAILPASATATSFGGFPADIILASQGSFCTSLSRRCLSTEVAPRTSNCLQIPLPHLGDPPEPLPAGGRMLPRCQPYRDAKSRPRRKLAIGGAKACTAMAQIGPMPGMVISRLSSSRSLALVRIFFSRPAICSVSKAICVNSSSAISATCSGGGSCAPASSWRSLSTFAVPPRCNQAELGEMAPERVDGLGSLPHHECPGSEQHGIGLGFLGLHGHKAHGRALCGQGGGGSIIHVILLPLDEGLDIDRRYEPALVAHGGDLADPSDGHRRRPP